MIISGSDTCFRAGPLDNFTEISQIKWKTVPAHAPMSNDEAEKMVETIKRAHEKMGNRHGVYSDPDINKNLYGYRRRRMISEI